VLVAYLGGGEQVVGADPHDAFGGEDLPGEDGGLDLAILCRGVVVVDGLERTSGFVGDCVGFTSGLWGGVAIGGGNGR
jgi:hypothetical protein